MAYDSKTFGQSPFGQTVATTAAKSRRSKTATTPTAEDALSDQIGDDQIGDDPLNDNPLNDDKPGENAPEKAPPELPADRAPHRQLRRAEVSLFYLPQGRIGGLNLLGEAVGWLLLWGTVGFFRAYIPPPVLALFDRLFHPYCTAGNRTAQCLAHRPTPQTLPAQACLAASADNDCH